VDEVLRRSNPKRGPTRGIPAKGSVAFTKTTVAHNARKKSAPRYTGPPPTKSPVVANGLNKLCCEKIVGAALALVWKT
jgi:hypothetical protein